MSPIYYLRDLRALCVFLVLLCLFSLANAQDFDYSANGGRVRNLGLDSLRQAEGRLVWQNVMAAGAATGDAKATLALSATVESRAVAMSAARTVPWAAVAGAAAKVLPIAGAAWTAYEAANLVRCYATSGNIFCDPGAEPAETMLPVWVTNGHTAASAESSCAAFVAGNFADPRYRIVLRDPPQFNDGYPVYSCNRFDGITNGQEVYGGNYTTTVNGQTVPGTECPASIDASNPANNIPAGSPVGPDGKCPTARYNHGAATEAQVASKIQQYADKSKAALIAAEATGAGKDLSPSAGPASLTGPATSTAPPRVSTTTNPDGSTQTQSQQRQANITYQGDSYTYNISNVTTTTNNGGTTTTETSEQPEVDVCGLPGKPPCKIDETGTPTESGLDPAQATEDALAQAKAFAQDPVGSLPPHPELNWTFSLPTGCAPIPVGMGDFLEAIDICQFQPMFHEIMSIVWVMGGLFGAISHFFRNVYSQG